MKATQYPTAREAIDEMDAQGHDEAITTGHGYYTCTAAECRKLAEAGVEYACIAMDHQGRIMTIPVN